MSKKAQLKVVIIFSCILVLSLVFIPSTGSSGYDSSPIKTYTSSSEKICYNGICNLVLYSGLVFYNNGIRRNL
jgi:hypothetical protein